VFYNFNSVLTNSSILWSSRTLRPFIGCYNFKNSTPKISLSFALQYNPQETSLDFMESRNLFDVFLNTKFLIQQFFGPRLTLKVMHFYNRNKDTINFRKRSNLYSNFIFNSIIPHSDQFVANLPKFILFLFHTEKFLLKMKKTPHPLFKCIVKERSLEYVFFNFSYLAGFLMNHEVRNNNIVLKLRISNLNKNSKLYSSLVLPKWRF